MPYANSQRKYYFALASLLFFTTGAAARDKQTYLEFQYLQAAANRTPNTPPLPAPDGKVRKMWRSGSRYLRLEEPPDPQTGMIATTIVDEPHIFVLFEKAGLAQHALDSGPTFDAHAPVFPGLPKDEITKLELGEEISFFRAHRAKRAADETSDGIRCAVFNLLIGEEAVRLHVDQKRRVPVRLSISGPKRSGIVRYHKYNKEQFDAQRYTVPAGMRLIEIARPNHTASDSSDNVEFRVYEFEAPDNYADSAECLRRPIVLYFFQPGKNEAVDESVIAMRSHYQGGQLCFLPTMHRETPDSSRVVREHKFNFPIYTVSGLFPKELLPAEIPAAVLIDRDQHFEKISALSGEDREEIARKVELLVDDGSWDSKIKFGDLEARRRADSNEEPGFDAFMTQVKKYRADGKFEDLDRLADKLRSSRDRWSNGGWKLKSFYDAVSSVNDKTERGFSDATVVLEHWARSRPKSPTPRIALGRLMIRYAFAGRGGGWAQDLSADQKQKFEERLSKAEVILDAAKTLTPTCPELYAQLVDLGSAQGWPRNKIDAVYAEGSLIEPDYQYLHSAMTFALLPKWGGEPGEWEAFAKNVAESTGRHEQYARIVLLIMDQSEFGRLGENLFTNSRIEWAELKKGFIEMQGRYPNSVRNSNYFAWFATLAKDKEAAKSAFLRIGDNYNATIWLNNVNYEHWRRWANSKNPVQTKSERRAFVHQNADQDKPPAKEKLPLSY